MLLHRAFFLFSIEIQKGRHFMIYETIQAEDSWPAWYS